MHAGNTRALQMSLSVGKTNLLLRNLLRTPILELEASKLNLGVCACADGWWQLLDLHAVSWLCLCACCQTTDESHATCTT